MDAFANGYPGDFDGAGTVAYDPEPDGQPDPGEIVWTWVPYEEDFTQGKDRPVLIVGFDRPYPLGLTLTSRDRDDSDERYVEIGSGAWDRDGRPSEVRADRVVRIDPNAVRREGAVLDADVFERVAQALRRERGWS